MKTGRPRKPTALKLLAGDKPSRIPQNEPKPRPVRPEMPDYLDAYGQKRWKELVSELEACGVLTFVDRDVLGGYCDAFARFVSASKRLKQTGWVTTTKSGYTQQNPWVGIRNRALDDLRKFGAELGIGAASRSRIEVAKPNEHVDPLSEIMESTRRRRESAKGRA